MTHLSASLLDDLLEGRLSGAQAAALRSHLDAGPCQVCGPLLGGVPDLDVLARLLATHGAAPVSPGDPDALWRGVAATLPRRKRRRAPWILALAAVAALLLVLRPPPPEDGIKGLALASPVVALRVAVGEPGPEGLAALERVGDGDAVPRDGTLIFDLDVDRPAARYLAVVDGQGRLWPLAPAAAPALEPAGSRRVRQGDGWVALGLADMVGPLTLLAGATEEPRPPDAVFEALRGDTCPQDVGCDRIRVRLAPE